MTEAPRTRPRRPLFQVAPGRTTPAPGRSAAFLAGTVLENMRAGVRLVLSQPPRTAGIDEVDDDPRYENLYDRFYAIMSDGAALEHLAVAHLVDGGDDVRRGGARALTSLTTAWAGEADRAVDYGNAYATSRLLKSLAVGHSAFAVHLPARQSTAVDELLTRLAGNLWRQWFSRSDIRGRTGLRPGLHSPHHASVEWSAFGVAALALVDLTDEAQGWVDATVEHFETELLPRALAVDGAPVEGWGFWVSTMFSRAQFVDALRTVTGHDLLRAHPACVRTEMADVLLRPTPPLGGFEEGEDRLVTEDWQLLPRGAGTVLLWLAAQLGDTRLQALGMLDHRAGAIESSSFTTPTSGTRLRLATSSYAALWMSTRLEPVGSIEPRTAAFPSVSLCATSRGWRTGGFAAAVDEGRVLLWAGDALVLRDLVPESRVDLEASRAAGTGVFEHHPADLFGLQVTATQGVDGDLLEARNDVDDVVARVLVTADGTTARVERRLATDHTWRTALQLADDGGTWRLDGDGATVVVAATGCRIVSGGVADVSTTVGYGLLTCRDDPRTRPLHDHRLVATTDVPWGVLDLRLEGPAVPEPRPAR